MGINLIFYPRACTACIRVLMDLDINKTLYKEDQLPNPALTNHLIASATAKMINSESSLVFFKNYVSLETFYAKKK